MLLTSRQQAWIRGLPGLDKEGGISVNTLRFPLPTPDNRSLRVTLYGSSELISSLLLLFKNRTKLSQLSITIRTDTAKELDNQIQLTDVVIDSVTLLADKTAVQINILFNSIYARMGLSQNPGPPINCPPVRPTGVNTGWIFGPPMTAGPRLIPVEILDFMPPNFDGRLTLRLERSSSELEDLTQNPALTQDLILVLPDRIRECYIEFKLGNAKTTVLADKKTVNFETDWIECLTGQSG